MKILFITVRSDFGGGPRHVDQLIKELPSNYEVFLAYPKDGIPYAQNWDSLISSENRIYIPYRKFSIRTLFSLYKFIKKNKIDIVHSHGNGAGIYSRLLKILGTKAKVVHTFHGITTNYSSKFKFYLNKLTGIFLRPFTDKFILVSNGELNLARQMHFVNNKKANVIYNGIDSSNIKAKSDHFKVITLSRFDFQKNMDLAYQIAKSLKDENIEFIWVGNGDDWERLKKQSEAEHLNIRFTGFSNHPIDYLACSTVYLSTSRFEGLPYALIEAASIGLPIVATDVVGNNEVVENNKNGFLFNTLEEANGFLKQLLHDKDLVSQMSEESIKFYNQNFTTEKMVSSLCDLYASTCAT